jgi:hypothetical protein
MDWTDDFKTFTKTASGKPQHPHDCKKCEYKGSIGKFDVYVCPKPDGRQYDSMIARYGKNGEYASFPRSVFAQAVSDHILGNVVEDGKRNENIKIPDWMVAIIVMVFAEKENA